MKAFLRLLIASGVLLSVTCTVFGACSRPLVEDAVREHQSAPPFASQALTDWPKRVEAARLIESHMKTHDVPGLSAAIAKNGQIVFSRGFGWSDYERRTPAQPATIFRLASVSKPITAILTLELMQRGDFDIHKSVRQYLPELPSFHEYPVWLLIAHQSGVRHYNAQGYDPTFAVTRHYARAADAMNLFVNDKLVMAPGTRFSYSTHAYTILAAAIEKTTGKPFAEYATERFRTWGLSHLQPEQGQRWHRSQLYRKPGASNVPDDRDALSWKYAGGGLESTAEDLCTLGIKLLNGSILDRTTLDSMWSRKQAKGSLTNYGYGWFIGSSQGRRLVSHAGEQPGADSYWLVYRDDGVVVTVLTNRRRTASHVIATELGTLALGD